MRKILTGIVTILLLVIALAVFAFLGGGQTSAQDEPTLTEFKLWSSYWTVEPGFTSTLEMKNNRMEETVDAQVVLYLSNGRHFYLDPVQLEPRRTVVLDLN